MTFLGQDMYDWEEIYMNFYTEYYRTKKAEAKEKLNAVSYIHSAWKNLFTIFETENTFKLYMSLDEGNLSIIIVQYGDIDVTYSVLGDSLSAIITDTNKLISNTAVKYI